MTNGSQNFKATARRGLRLWSCFALLLASVMIADTNLSIAFTNTAQAQDLPAPAEETTKESGKKPKRSRRFLTLTVGVEQDEKLPIKMKSLSRENMKGTWRNVVGVTFSEEINTLRFSPNREGVATLIVIDSKQRVVAEYRIEVRKSRLDGIARELRSLMGDIEGITIKIVNNKVIVDGQIVIPKDMYRIHTVVKQYGDQVSSIVTLSPMAQKRIAEFIEKDIQNPEVRVRALNDKFILEGMVNSDDERNKAEIVAKAYVQPTFLESAIQDGIVRAPRPANDGIINLISVRPAAPPPPSKTVQLVIHYVELKKDYSRGFRFQFMPNLQDNSQLTFRSGENSDSDSGWNITGIIDNLLPKLNWSKQHGYARVLESTSLIVQDGKRGVLNSTREIPYTTASGDQGVPVTAFKDVGIATAITPVILGERSDSLSLSMEFDISSLVGLTDAGPLTSRNKITSDLVVRSGQSAAVGGLISNRATTNYNKLPKGVAENPIITLYASKDFQRDQSQFVVFVTPIIKSSASSGAEKIKRKFRLRD
jgi:pilus assembly protein CpaC